MYQHRKNTVCTDWSGACFSYKLQMLLQATTELADPTIDIPQNHEQKLLAVYGTGRPVPYTANTTSVDHYYPSTSDLQH